MIEYEGLMRVTKQTDKSGSVHFRVQRLKKTWGNTGPKFLRIERAYQHANKLYSEIVVKTEVRVNER